MNNYINKFGTKKKDILKKMDDLEFSKKKKEKQKKKKLFDKKFIEYNKFLNNFTDFKRKIILETLENEDNDFCYSSDFLEKMNKTIDFNYIDYRGFCFGEYFRPNDFYTMAQSPFLSIFISLSDFCFFEKLDYDVVIDVSVTKTKEGEGTVFFGNTNSNFFIKLMKIDKIERENIGLLKIKKEHLEDFILFEDKILDDLKFKKEENCNYHLNIKAYLIKGDTENFDYFKLMNY